MIMWPLSGALLFALTGYAAVLLAKRLTRGIEPYADGPQASAEPPVWLLVLGCSIVGAFVVSGSTAAMPIAVGAVACAALAAAWYSDATCGIVPDLFTIAPLAIVLGIGAAEHQWSAFAAALFPFVPFAAAALLSNGRGMGWADVKLAALAGAVLGAQVALLALAAACITAVVYARARKTSNRPIAFAPYIAVAVAAAIPLAGLL